MRDSKLTISGYLLIALVMVLSLAFSSAVEALQIKVTDSATSYSKTIDDVDGDTFNNGVINWQGPVGYFNLAMTLGWSKPEIGNTDIPKLELNCNANSYSHTISGIPYTGSTLTIEMSDTGFILAANGLNGFTTSLGGSNRNNTVTLSTWFDNNNGIFVQGSPISSLEFTGGGASYSADKIASTYPGNSPFSVTMVATIMQSGGTSSTKATTQLTGRIIPNPEPGTILLLGLGLLGLGIISRRKAEIEG